MATFDCFKCAGTGEVAFRHIDNGRCFQCGGTGKLAFRKHAAWVDPHPELLVDEALRPTEKQWNYLSKLVRDDEDKFCAMIRKAGGRYATARYLTKAIVSRAINLAKEEAGR